MGTGGYGIRPYGTAGNEIVGAHSICARWQPLAAAGSRKEKTCNLSE